MDELLQRAEKAWSKMDKDTREVVAEAMFVPLVQRVKDLMDENQELEAKLAKAAEKLLAAAEDMDGYVRHGYGDDYREAAAELTTLKEK